MGDVRGSPTEVLRVFARLGVTSFGGPIAHLGYFRDEFVTRRRWIDDVAYADLVALCQFLPGPASSQVGFSIGLSRAGYLGGLAAWTGFTLPSAIFDLWRKGGDSNPRDGVRPPNGFQDRRIQPLCHPSVRFMMANGAEARLRASADRDGRLYTGIPSRERWPSG